jgi:hypothetical protein
MVLPIELRCSLLFVNHSVFEIILFPRREASF